jgi:hypothetical protein
MAVSYPFSCHQELLGPCELKRTGSANHIIEFFDLRLLIRYNFAVYLITERRSWWQLNGYPEATVQRLQLHLPLPRSFPVQPC